MHVSLIILLGYPCFLQRFCELERASVQTGKFVAVNLYFDIVYPQAEALAIKCSIVCTSAGPLPTELRLLNLSPKTTLPRRGSLSRDIFTHKNHPAARPRRLSVIFTLLPVCIPIPERETWPAIVLVFPFI
jgi:hypothetical protein